MGVRDSGCQGGQGTGGGGEQKSAEGQKGKTKK